MVSLWAAAASTYVVGETVTTAYGINNAAVEEGHPLSADVLATGGITGMVLLKLAVFGAFYLGTKELVPREWEHGVPIGLTVLGLVITMNNLTVIAEAESR